MDIVRNLAMHRIQQEHIEMGRLELFFGES